MEGRITSITRQKKDKRRASIFLDEEYAFGVNDQTIEEFRLRKGDYIDREFFDKISAFDFYVEAKRIALAYLNFRARSEKEIRERLAKEEIPTEIIERVLVFLREYKMVDDESWSRAFINDKLQRKPLSSRSLEFELTQKGISKELAAQAVSELNQRQSDGDRAETAASKRWERLLRTESDERKRKQKLFSFLASRGFSFDLIERVYKKLAPDAREQEFE